MEKVIQAIDILWPVLLAFLAYIVWLIRMEGKQMFLSTQLKELREDFKEYRDKTDAELDDVRVRITNIDSDLMRQISDVRESLARIEGALGLIKKG
jgi:FtsZ-interacting cell division protein ZipA